MSLNLPSTAAPHLSTPASMSAAAPSAAGGPNVNGASPPSTSTPNPTAGRPQLRMTNSQSKSSDAARKQSASPMDAAQRKPAPRAWQGTNPITQRPSNMGTPNGYSSPKHTQTPALAPDAAPPTQRKQSERMLYLLTNLQGLRVDFVLKNGEKYTGVLSGTSLDPNELRYVFKMVKHAGSISGTAANGTDGQSDAYVGNDSDHVMSVDVADVAHLHAQDVVFDGRPGRAQNGTPSGFLTDTGISGNAPMRERTLQKWTPAETDVNLSLESTSRNTEWDQFSTNERLFGVTSNYDESFYTTTIDRNSPQYAEREARAARIAREIENSAALNSHVREERSEVTVDDKGDEEDKYSGVRRDFPPLATGGSNKYTPPARRAPTAQPVPAEPHMDPAIISHQVARPDSAAQRSAVPTPPPPAPEASNASPASRAEPAPEPVAKAESAVPESGSTADQAAKPNGGAAAPVTATTDRTTPASAAAPAPTANGAAGPSRPDAHHVERDLLNSFRQFSESERQRLAQRSRQQAQEAKAVKLNDLKKFSQNFKLNSPVPRDLLPILAKDKTKQDEILAKTKVAVATQDTVQMPTAAPSRPVAPGVTAPRPGPNAPAAVPTDRQGQRPRPGPGPNNFPPGPGMGRGHPGTRGGLLSQRLQINQQQHRQGPVPPFHGIPNPVPPYHGGNSDMRVPSGPAAPAGAVTQTASNAGARFNVRAPDFRPNPAASTFQPGGNPSTHSSPRPESVTRKETPRKRTSFFGGKRPTVIAKDDWLDPRTFNPVARMLKEVKASAELQQKYSRNCGLPEAYRTFPTWDFPKINEEKSHKAMLEDNARPLRTTHPNGMPNNGQIPHQHQLPQQLQGPTPPGGPTPGQTPRHVAAQPHHGPGGPPHFDGHSMQYSHSQPSIQPSPRPQPPFMYGQQQPMAGFPQQPQMPGYGMSPVPPNATLRQPSGPHFMGPQVPGMGGQMMVAQHSNGPYMGMNPQMPMYQQMPGPGAYYPNQMPGPPASNGYPSPRPVGVPMMHQGSQQGHQQQPFGYMAPAPHMFQNMPPGAMSQMRPPYPQGHQGQHYSPQQHHAAQAHRGNSSGSYSQPMMHQHSQHSMPPHGPPPPSGPANHNQDGTEDGK